MPELGQLSFDERLGLLVDAECLARENKRLGRLLKEAKLRLGQACIEDIDYAAGRELDKAVVRQLATCRWVHEHQNVLVTGMTGVGKTYVACALAQQACRKGYRAIYRRASRLFEELSLARADGSYARLLVRLARIDVLVIDDWGLSPPRDQERRDLLEVLEDRYGQPLHDHHQPAADQQVARVPRRSDHRRRHPRPRPPQRPPPRAKGSVSARPRKEKRDTDR